MSEEKERAGFRNDLPQNIIILYSKSSFEGENPTTHIMIVGDPVDCNRLKNEWQTFRCNVDDAVKIELSILKLHTLYKQFHNNIIPKLILNSSPNAPL